MEQTALMSHADLLGKVKIYLHTLLVAFFNIGPTRVSKPFVMDK